jgi:hypothetical protein
MGDSDFTPPPEIRDPFADDAPADDPLAGGGNWEGGPWEGGGGSVHDDQGNTVIMTKEGDVATMTPPRLVRDQGRRDDVR